MWLTESRGSGGVIEPVLLKSFSGAPGHDQSTGSVNGYCHEITNGRMQITGMVYKSITIERPDHVWRQNNGHRIEGQTHGPLSGLFRLDPLQPLYAPPDTNLWLRGPFPANVSCVPGSPSPQLTTFGGSDWCFDPVIVDSNLVPMIKAAAATACGTTSAGTATCGFSEANFDVVIDASPYVIQSVTVARHATDKTLRYVARSAGRARDGSPAGPTDHPS